MISIRSTLKALLAALLSATALIFIFAFIAYKNPDPHKLLPSFGILCFCISCFTGGAVSRRGDNTGFLNTLLFGAIFIPICFLLSLLSDTDIDLPGLLLCYAGGIGSCIVGSVLFAGGKRKKPKGLKKYKSTKR